MSGFVYLWYDRKHKRYYVGSHWGSDSDPYLCSSAWMKRAYVRRPYDFKRRIIARVTTTRKDLLIEEQRWLNMMKSSEMKPLNPHPRYYNLMRRADHLWHAQGDEILLTISEKISIAKHEKMSARLTPGQQRCIEAMANSVRGVKRPPRTKEHSQKIADKVRGRKHSEQWKADTAVRVKEQWATGVRKGGYTFTMPPEAIEKIRRANIGKKMDEATKLKISKNYIVTDPQGNEHQVINLRQFCIDRGLQNTNITKPSGSKGWRARKID